MYTYNCGDAIIYWLSHPYSKVICVVHYNYWKRIRNIILNGYLGIPITVKENSISISKYDWFIMRVNPTLEDINGFCSNYICFLFELYLDSKIKNCVIELYNLRLPQTVMEES